MGPVLSGSVSVDTTRTISMSWYFHNNVRIFYVRTFFTGPGSRLPALLSMVSRREEGEATQPGPAATCGAAAVAVLMEILKYCGGHKSVNNHHY